MVYEVKGYQAGFIFQIMAVTHNSGAAELSRAHVGGPMFCQPNLSWLVGLSVLIITQSHSTLIQLLSVATFASSRFENMIFVLNC